MYQYYIKRLLDIIIALIFIPIFIIIIPPVFLMIKFEDRGPMIYKSKRLGKNMKEFNMYKFRTMTVNAPDIRNNDGSTFNSDNDFRLTKIGKILRKTSIDEIPQIINILKGDMSLVGPRPSPLGNKEFYPKEFFEKFKVLPGITGYNQAVLRNNCTMEQRVENDLYYVNNISLYLDLKILFLTFITVLGRKNINKGSEVT